MGPSWTQLEAQKQLLLARSLAPNSLNTYRTGINQYLRFCGSFGIRPLPLSENVLENFCVSLCHRISHKSIKVYLCGVQYLSKINGFRSLIEHMLRLDYVIKAIRRFQGNKFNRPARPPVTWQMLCDICAFLAGTEQPFNRDMLISAVLLAFFGLLRVSEYTTPSASFFDEDTHLSPADVTFNWKRRVALIRIKKSKTDPFRQGVTIRVGILDHYLCPVHALLRYLVRRGPAPGPLFIFQDGTFLTRAKVLNVLTSSLPHVPHVNTHSFRRGGASALADANTPSHVIQIMGRWKSNAYMEYILLTDEFLISAQLSMSHEVSKHK